MDDVLRKHTDGGAIEIVRRIEVQILGEDLQQVLAALLDVVRQEFDAVNAHERQQSIVPPLEIGLAVFEFYGSELAPQDRHEEVATPAGWLQKAGVDSLRLVFHQIEHRLNDPRGSKDFPVV